LNENIAIEQDPYASINWLAEKKSHLTNIIALACVALGYYIPNYGEVLTSAGYFAFSGAVTNWLAVYMLFEKIPLLYGSGIIPLRFEEFKVGIKNLILQQFFTEENIQRFLTNSLSKQEIQTKLNAIDFDKIYQGLTETIMQSSFGNMLNMFGGKEALLPLKDPIINKLKSTLSNVAESSIFTGDLKNNVPGQLRTQIEQIVIDRLNELTPQMVKQIIQDMIQRHLGWLVVWGGVFGGVIGTIVTISHSI
jgi:uncharacterized membrane protein YheB (UPF0754 family)